MINLLLLFGNKCYVAWCVIFIIIFMINKIFLYFNIMQHTINTYEITFYFTKNIAGHAYLGFLYYDARFPQGFKQLSCELLKSKPSSKSGWSKIRKLTDKKQRVSNLLTLKRGTWWILQISWTLLRKKINELSRNEWIFIDNIRASSTFLLSAYRESS